MVAKTKKANAPQPQPTTSKIKANKKARLISSKLSYKGKVFSVYTDKVEEPGGGINTRDVILHNV
jgi:ADP-ribose pyrophosphatase